MTFSAMVYELEDYPSGAFCREAWETGCVYLINGKFVVKGREMTIEDLTADDWRYCCSTMNFMDTIKALESKQIKRVRRFAWKRGIAMHEEDGEVIIEGKGMYLHRFSLSVKDVLATDWMVIE